MTGDISGVKSGSVGATGTQCIESIMLLNILQCTGQSPQLSHLLAENDNTAKAEKPYIKL